MMWTALAEAILIAVLAALIGVIEKSNALERGDRARAHEAMVQTLLERIQRPDRPMPVPGAPELRVPVQEPDELELVGSIAYLEEDPNA